MSMSIQVPDPDERGRSADGDSAGVEIVDAAIGLEAGVEVEVKAKAKTKTTAEVEVEVQRQVQDCRHCPSDEEIGRWARLAIASEANRPIEQMAGRTPQQPMVEPLTAETEPQLTIRIVDSEEMQAANRQWRSIDKPTNVLSFPSDLPPETGLSYYGDMMICAEVLAAESATQGKSNSAHWAHIVVHGTLHLLGYDHIDSAEAEAMERREIEILATLGIENPYLEVGDTENSPIGGQ